MRLLDYLLAVTLLCLGSAVLVNAQCDGYFGEPKFQYNALGMFHFPPVSCIHAFNGTCVHGNSSSTTGCNCACICEPGWGGATCNETLVNGSLHSVRPLSLSLPPNAEFGSTGPPTFSNPFGMSSAILRFDSSNGMKLRRTETNESAAWVSAFASNQITIEMWIALGDSDPFAYLSDFTLFEATPGIFANNNGTRHHRFVVGYSDRSWFAHADVSYSSVRPLHLPFVLVPLLTLAYHLIQESIQYLVQKIVLKSFLDATIVDFAHVAFVYHTQERAFASGDFDAEWKIYVNGRLMDSILQYTRFNDASDLHLNFGTYFIPENRETLFPNVLRLRPWPNVN